MFFLQVLAARQVWSTGRAEFIESYEIWFTRDFKRLRFSEPPREDEVPIWRSQGRASVAENMFIYFSH
jgi:hypothetical protein